MTGPDVSTGGTRAWVTVALLWLVACMEYVTRVMLTTMHQSVIAAVPMTEAQFGLLTSSFLWVYGLCSPLAGFMSDRFSRSRVITVSLLVSSILTFLSSYSRTFPELLAMRALIGLGQACYLPAALALISEYHRGSTRSLATGVHMTGIMFGSGISGLGGWIAEHRSWHFAFSAVGAAGLAYTLIIWLFLCDVPREHSESTAGHPALPVNFREAIASLFSYRGFIFALLFWGLLGFVSWGIAGWMPTLVQERFHLGQGAAGLSASGYIYTASLCGVLAGGAWADRWSRSRPTARIYVPVIGTCLAAPGIFLIVHTSVLGWALAGLALYGFTRVFADANMMPILCLVSDARYRATGYGVLNFLSCICGGLAIYVGGLVRDAHMNFSTVLGYCAFGMVLCAGLLLLIRAAATRLPPQSNAATP